ncbi:hypothetical protein BLEM_0340 [Bifidobacterium lemurum]|uniref:Uncharacterized protein n=1 Tax=Bifidobacterium lemurum TaxID=1603886 RepID=A0A261FVS1_9BIFI|nr:hypothetical protein [Bifidobacterium lemurum]OZG63075.1 hypothetical protein BLEM_0340 [Bifidobacterium lemurum]QOL33408.1 hypothetical protein BL8807_06205 [Bifidobacterium lemurum]
MHNPNEEPRGGSIIWLMAVLVIALSAKVDSTAADVAILALTMYAIRAGISRQ